MGDDWCGRGASGLIAGTSALEDLERCLTPSLAAVWVGGVKPFLGEFGGNRERIRGGVRFPPLFCLHSCRPGRPFPNVVVLSS